ncbi:hypothetical protein ROA7450_00525 [Roseovarius albus]|uniref:Uncharacterized protein n=1 Tax=Roseovarius albus TaxID=1247867 RepID=A0A1X6YCA1_9RHOB|nr:DUF4169 family protein [Roseovarius albus]SLN17175.1 hypothetical protein ROA7450_00525 [Roseovarius albus]
MGKPVNLNRFRKEKARADKKARADENAIKFGRSKADKELDRARSQKQERDLSDHKRDP